MTGEELRSLNEKVRRTIFKREEFCRRVLAGKTTREIFPPGFPILIRDYRRLCNVLHQLLKIASNTSLKAAQLLQAALDEAHLWNEKMVIVYIQDEYRRL
ncbi:MAG: hypothetical protein IJP43_03250 [Oscillospiraceae bacterium]|nr:hypothetical protein [Oscillospiraceae bacterium]